MTIKQPMPYQNPRSHAWDAECFVCGKKLTIADDIHIDSDEREVCEDCCDVCVAEEIELMDLEDKFDILFAEEAAGAYVPFQSAPKHEMLPDWQRDDYIGD